MTRLPCPPLRSQSQHPSPSARVSTKTTRQPSSLPSPTRVRCPRTRKARHSNPSPAGCSTTLDLSKLQSTLQPSTLLLAMRQPSRQQHLKQASPALTEQLPQLQPAGEDARTSVDDWHFGPSRTGYGWPWQCWARNVGFRAQGLRWLSKYVQDILDGLRNPKDV